MSNTYKDINEIKNADFSQLSLKKEPTQNSQFYEIVSEDGNLQLNVTQETISREKSEYKGFVYHVPQFNNITTLLTFLGEEQVLGLANAKIATMVATRATNRIDREVSDKIGDRKEKEGETEDQYSLRRLNAIKERLLSNPIAFTATEAVNYIPGERELSLPSLLAKINKLNKTAQEYLKANELSRAMELFDSIKSLMSVMNEMVEKARVTAGATSE